MSAQRLALDLQQSREALAEERKNVEKLLEEMDRLNDQVDRLRSSTRRESDSRLLAEGALDKTRERLQLAVDAAGLALWDWLIGSPEAFLTARWGEILGSVALEGHWKLADLLALVHPEDRARMQAAARTLLTGSDGPVVAQYRVRTADGWLWIESHGMVAERDRQGKPLRLMGTLADISQRKRVEDEVMQARQMAEQANHAKSDFLANISHEVRTPLNALMGLTQLLLESSLSPEQKRWLDLMDSSSQALLHLLNDVLDFSRIEAGKLTVENMRFDLHALLDEMASLHAAQAHSKSLRWALIRAPDVPRFTQGDPNRLRQVILNLLSNAFKFTPPEGKVELLVDAGPAGLGLRVRDTGIGITKAKQDSIFEAFTQADQSTHRSYGGSGLGLAICARLIQLMGGQISVSSEPGQGSTFTVTLPQADPAAHEIIASEPESLPAVEKPMVSQRFAGLTVLAVDDHPINELLMEKHLTRLGCHVRIARNGHEAVAEWERGGLDLILMDVQMPGMNGLDATGKIRAAEAENQRPRTWVIAITANATTGDRATCLAAGMDGYVSKPIRQADLLDAMDAALTAIQARRGAPGETASGALASREQPTTLATGRLTAVHETGGYAQPPEPVVDADTAQQIVRLLNKDLPHRLELLTKAGVTRDTAIALEQSHLLVGILGMSSAPKAARLARGLELAVQADNWTLYSKVLSLFEAEIATLLGTAGSTSVGVTSSRANAPGRPDACSDASG
jgi:signal transduction histidine kinase/DNA-binding NarL/FixJ family response regulator/HPt (histidine-containing phosphotransfer) domain-containing protein